MPNVIPISFQTAGLDPAFTGTPSEMWAEGVRRLQAVSQQEVGLTVIGSTEPAFDAGPWYDTVNRQWKGWSNTTGNYQPVNIPTQSLRFAVQATEPAAAETLFWIVTDSITGLPEDIRTFAGGSWTSVLRGTANSVAAFGSSGSGLISIATFDEGRVLVSGGGPIPPSYKYAGYRVGDVKETFRATPDPGWAALGATLSRTTHSALFNELIASGAINMLSGDGSTTYVVPDFRGRSTIAAGSGSGLTARTVGQTGGFERVALAVGELPALSGTNNQMFAFVTAGTGTAQITAPGSANITTGPIMTGLGQTHENMGPFGVLNKFIFHGQEA